MICYGGNYMNKTKIRSFAEWAREKLIADITFKAGMLGISENGIAEKLPQSTNDLELYDIGTKNYIEVSGKEIEQRKSLVSAIKAKERDIQNYKEAYEFIIEEVAYTWFNRLIAIRFMEVNEYLPSGIRVLSSDDPGKIEPDIVTTPFDADLDLTSSEQGAILELKDQNKLSELFQMLFIKQCNLLHEILPRLFEKTNDYSELLLSLSFTDVDGIVYHLVHDIDEDDFNLDKEGHIEIIGWMYQYYNIVPKAEVFARPKGKKIRKEQIPAATQLFTPKWIVRYMVENSLGRLWYEGHNDTDIKDKWKYYIDEATQNLDIKEKLDMLKESYEKISPEDIKLIDPCMGSGHILVYAFDILMQIYESCGYTQRDAARLIVEQNIYGLDLDERAAQLSYFAVMMKGRQYDRRFLTRGIEPHIYDIPNIEVVDTETIDAFEECASIAKRVCNSFIDGKEYGSLVTPDVSLDEIETLTCKLNEMKVRVSDIFVQSAINTVTPILDIIKILVQKYDVVITNPPYMAVSNAGAKLNDFVKQCYPDSKADMFAVFIERCNTMVKQNGFQAMITMHSWMFLSSFEKLRAKLLLIDTVNMVHLGARAFEEIGGEVVQTTAFVFRKSSHQGYKGIYCRLIEPNSQQGKEDMFLGQENRFIINQSNFNKIPGSPIVYWLSDNFLNNFEEGEQLKLKGDTRQGMATSDNNRFLRFWFEVQQSKLGLSCPGAEKAKEIGKKWYPYNKGGEFRKWYGNIAYVINYENDGYEVKEYASSLYKSPTRTIKSISEYFKPCISWSKISGGSIAFRYYPKGFIFDVAGCCIFYKDMQMMFFDCGFLNSSISQAILEAISPTLNYEAGHIAALPMIRNCHKISAVNKMVSLNIEKAKTDWDAFETSWDFTTHPLIKNRVASIKESYAIWEEECYQRFTTLKANEEELNRIFIDIYGLQDELTPDVEDKDVTVRKADLQRDIKSLISYAVGCMFGRYSLDVEGIAYAGGEWDESQYRTYLPDEDNCIPITDEAYFEDDVVGRFCDFIKTAFGEESLEDNLTYIAEALGNSGNTSREVIRNYFLGDFIKDHNKIYQGRPIYWLFDSGKQKGFKALVYMHRWNADTTGHMRVEYLHRMQKVYEREIERMQETIDHSSDNREITRAAKRKEKLQKQLKETQDYDKLVAHLAFSRVDIDLDDGVKVNHEKVQTSSDGKKMSILAKLK